MWCLFFEFEKLSYRDAFFFKNWTSTLIHLMNLYFTIYIELTGHPWFKIRAGYS